MGIPIQSHNLGNTDLKYSPVMCHNPGATILTSLPKGYFLISTGYSAVSKDKSFAGLKLPLSQ